MKTRFVKVPAVKDHAHRFDRRVSSSFLYALDVKVAALLDRVCREHNGGRRTLDAELLGITVPTIAKSGLIPAGQMAPGRAETLEAEKSRR